MWGCDRAFVCAIVHCVEFSLRNQRLNFWEVLVANIESVCYDDYLRAISTVVAHFLHTEGVTGSNPVLPIQNLWRLIRHLQKIKYPVGVRSRDPGWRVKHLGIKLQVFNIKCGPNASPLQISNGLRLFIEVTL